MTTEIIFASSKVEVAEEQLQRVLDRFDLGKLISWSRPTSGVMGQTIFISASRGEFIFKGNPLYEGQLLEEKFFVDNLHQRTSVPVPSPYIVDESDDIFGWSYSLMPRLPGIHFSKPSIADKLTHDDKVCIAQLLGQTLAESHTWKTPQFGEFDPKTQSLKPFVEPYQTWLYNRILYWLEDAKKYSIITPQDFDWVNGTLAKSEDAFEKLSSASFVMNDFKPDNFLVVNHEGSWTFSALFDFTTAYFGDPIADLSRMIIVYITRNEETLGRQFLASYINFSTNYKSLIERLQVHVLHQLVLDWGCLWAINEVTWDKTLSFSEWARQYTELLPSLLT